MIKKRREKRLRTTHWGEEKKGDGTQTRDKRCDKLSEGRWRKDRRNICF